MNFSIARRGRADSASAFVPKIRLVIEPIIELPSAWSRPAANLNCPTIGEPHESGNPFYSSHSCLARFSQAPIALLAVVAMLAFSAPAAKAEFIALSATAFVKRCPCNVNDEPNEVAGVLRPTVATRYFADVVFPTSGERVCAFRLVYRDVNHTKICAAALAEAVFPAAPFPPSSSDGA